MKRLIIGSSVFLILILFGIPSSAHALSPGFSNQQILSGLDQPTDLAFAPDGRIFIALKNGQVVIYKNGALLSTPALSMSMSAGGDRGLLSIALDPNFSSNNFVYLLYTTVTNHQRVSRFTAAGDTINPATETLLLENSEIWSGFLNAGTIRFAPDGKIFVTMGSNGLSANAQDLSSMDGKLLRINANGSIPADNPFVATPGAQGAIYSYGFRNPWKMSIDPAGNPIIGDVGENTWEKIVRAQKGANYGWPTFEGSCQPNCGGVMPPLYVYAHNGAGAAVVGGDIYRGGGNFPASFSGNYFFGDYVQGYIKNIILDGAGSVTSVQSFDTGNGVLSGMNFAPDGSLYYLTIFPGALHRIAFNTVAINESIAANPTSGVLPLNVQFSPGATTDSSGLPLNLTWNFGDGSPTSNVTSPSHTYNTQGTYTVTLTAGNANGSAIASTKIWPGFQPINVTINSPVQDSRYNDGNTINFSGSAIDPAQGPLPASALSWAVIFHHNTHIHAPIVYSGVSSGSFAIPTNDEPAANTWYEIDLTATNNAGLSTTKAVNIFPNVATMTFNSSPSGAQITLDAQPVTTPYVETSVVGYQHTVAVASPQTIGGVSYNFSSWSDSGAQNHIIPTPAANTTYTVNFGASGGGGGGTFVSSASTDAANYSAGAPMTVTATITSPTSLPTANFDIEVWSSAAKVAQNVSPQNLVAGQPLSAIWNTTAPASNGTYTIKLGVFADDWGSLYYWNNAAASFTVGSTPPPPPPPASAFAAQTALSAASYNPGDPVTLTTTITANQNVANALLDTEIYNSAGTKVGQNLVPVNLVANTAFSSSWNFAAPASAGTYTIKVGLFANDWSRLYFWDDASNTLTVGSTPPPPPPSLAFVISASMPKAVFNPGEASTLTTNIAATQNLPNVVIDIEIDNSSDVMVMQRVINTSLVANQLFTDTWNLNVPGAQDGYFTKIGIFSADWTQLYFWRNRSFQFNVGTPPGAPQPGQTYPINVLQPADNSTVTGVYEVRAVINGLDINSYNIGWRTGGGAFFNLDTDPITLAYKHAWIDFSAWTWSPNHQYVLEFQATDVNNNVIGDTVITITH